VGACGHGLNPAENDKSGKRADREISPPISLKIIIAVINFLFAGPETPQRH